MSPAPEVNNIHHQITKFAMLKPNIADNIEIYVINVISLDLAGANPHHWSLMRLSILQIFQ